MLTYNIEMANVKIISTFEREMKTRMGHIGGRIRKTAQRSIKFYKDKGEKPNPPGGCPKTRTGALPNSIIYQATSKGVQIGSSYQKMATIGGVHEQGLFYKGVQYPKRPFMMPALEKNMRFIQASMAGIL